MDIVTNGNELFVFPDALVSKAALPNLSTETKLRSGSIGEASFDLLHDSLDGAFPDDGQQSMEVVAHNHEGVEPVLSLVTIVEKSVDKECGHGF